MFLALRIFVFLTAFTMSASVPSMTSYAASFTNAGSFEKTSSSELARHQLPLFWSPTWTTQRALLIHAARTRTTAFCLEALRVAVHQHNLESLWRTTEHRAACGMSQEGRNLPYSRVTSKCKWRSVSLFGSRWTLLVALQTSGQHFEHRKWRRPTLPTPFRASRASGFSCLV